MLAVSAFSIVWGCSVIAWNSSTSGFNALSRSFSMSEWGIRSQPRIKVGVRITYVAMSAIISKVEENGFRLVMSWIVLMKVQVVAIMMITLNNTMMRIPANTLAPS